MRFFKVSLLLLAGHSLGAGVAALLGLLLRPQLPGVPLAVWAFAPPSGLLSPAAAALSTEFATSGEQLGMKPVQSHLCLLLFDPWACSFVTPGGICAGAGQCAQFNRSVTAATLICWRDWPWRCLCQRLQW